MDKILVEYDLEYKKFNASISAIEKGYNAAGAAGVKSANNTTTAFNKTANAAKNVTTNTKNIGSSFNQLGSQVQQIGASIGIAFGVQQIIQFGKASVEAFIDAEKNAQQLLNALNGNVDAQQRLLRQATEIQNNTIIDDDTVQNAQTFLALQGRTVPEIEKLINAGIELSTVMGTDLQTAVMQLDTTYEGNVGRLGKLDSEFKKLTKTQLQNGAAVDLILEKYSGTAKALGDTTAGQVAKLKNQFGELQETIGGEILPVITGLIDGLNKIAEGDILGGGDTIFDAIRPLAPQITEAKDAVSGFVSAAKSLGEGDLAAAFSKFNQASIDGAEALANSVTFGFHDKVKRYVVPAGEQFEDSLSGVEKAALQVIALSDGELTPAIEELSKQTGVSVEKLQQMADVVKKNEMENIFLSLASAVEITEAQFKRLTDITDQYGISSRVNSDIILSIKDATETDLNNAYLKFSKTLKVTRQDWDDYIGIVKGLKPLNEDVQKSTEKAIGPYQKLSDAVAAATKSLQDYAALSLKDPQNMNKVDAAAKNLAKTKRELANADAIVSGAQADLNEVLEETAFILDENGELVQTTATEYYKDAFDKTVEFVKARNDAEAKALEDNIAFNIDVANRKAQIFSDLGLAQVTEFEKTIMALNALREADMISEEEYYTAKTVAIASQAEQVAGNAAQAFGELGSALSQLFGDAAEQNALLAGFLKSITLAQIAFSAAQSIAGGIAAITKGAASGNPVDIISGVASIIAGFSSVFSGIVAQVEGTNIPAPPSFEKGSAYVQLGNNPKGIDTIPAMVNEGEAIIPTDKNKKYPGLAANWINGTLDQYLLNEIITPAIRDYEQNKQASFAENIAASMGVHESFNDFRLYSTGQKQIGLLHENNMLMRQLVKKDINKRNR